MDYQQARRSALAKGFAADEVDGFLVSAPVSVRYLAGRPAGRLLVTAKGAVLIADGPAADPPPPGVEPAKRAAGQSVDEVTAAAVGKAGCKSVGFEAEHLSAAAFSRLSDAAPNVTFVPTADRVERLRAVKDPQETEAVRLAVKAAERAFLMFVPMLRQEDTERDLTDALDGYVRRAGGGTRAVPPAVFIGEGGAAPDQPPGDRSLAGASKLAARWGADLGYACEVRRAVRSPFGATPVRRTKAERTNYDFETVLRAVTDAQTAAAAAARPGATAGEVDAAARKVLDAAGLAEFAAPTTGWGVGLEAAEAPFLAPKSAAEVKGGMVLTIAPSVAIPEWGGVWVGDPFLITRDGAAKLTRAI